MSANLTMTKIKNRIPLLSSCLIQDTLPETFSTPINNNGDNYGRVLELSHILHSSLIAEEILLKFSIEIAKNVTLDGLNFTNANEQLDIQIGTEEQHNLDYSITLHDTLLGRLQISRKQPFSEIEITTLEDFTTALAFPLLNAFNYAQAIRSSFLDTLTGASNRAALQHDLERECAIARRTGTPVSLLLLDIDHFKSVNDNWGHQCGDQALQAAAAAITESIRGSDKLYRYGGEEFLVIMASKTAEGAKLVAERTRKNIESMQIDSHKGRFSITTSIGVSTLNKGDDCHALIRRADEALYQAKRAGRNQVIAAQ